MLTYERENEDRFMQGTIENAILAGADMMKGKSMQNALVYKNWEKTQYRAADCLSDWAAQKGRHDAEDWKTNQQKSCDRHNRENKNWSGTESNRRHGDFQSPALPTELPDQPLWMDT